ncbi:hypothetical protein E2C01_023771 [Portunus trituberculatus]|uniref:Uncharacterized protein n=1 Tax=Portunus trituberculatus TaxID=210409 RepID=A0A5B7EAX8_PORTR|nr:hypothetical protein [Portunus trituberculatus]
MRVATEARPQTTVATARREPPLPEQPRHHVAEKEKMGRGQPAAACTMAPALRLLPSLIYDCPEHVLNETTENLNNTTRMGRNYTVYENILATFVEGIMQPRREAGGEGDTPRQS